MKSLSLRHALRRGAFHAFIGSALGLALFFSPQVAVVVGLAAVTAIFLSFEVMRLGLPSLNRWFVRWFAPLLRREEGTGLTTSSYFLAGCMITVLAVPKHIAVPAILFVALGDPAATAIGLWKGHIRPWRRSVEGHIACLVVCLLVGSLLACTLEGLSLTVAIVGAVSATLFEALPIPLDDNFTIPVGSAAAMVITSLLL